MAVVDAMIQTFTQQLTTAAINEAQFALEFKGQFEDMKKGLKRMKAFLVDTDNLKKKKEIVKTISNDMRELIYEADDILTDCLVREEYREGGSCSSFSLDEPLFRYQTGKKLKDINMRITKMEGSLGMYSMAQQGIHEDGSSQGMEHTSLDIEPSESEIIGLENDMQKIKGWILCKNEEPHQVGIVGMGGLGKTTIARKLFYDRQIVNHFKRRIWVTVSQTFSKEEIMKNMLKELGKNESDIGKMMKKIQEELGVENYLIVMDDVWSTTDPTWWNTLCSGISKPTDRSSCIIITTRHGEVASDMGVDKSRIHEPKLLSKEEGWSLFCKFAFSKSKGICPNTEFQKVGEEIVEKCGGLPLAIKTIGALLASKVESYRRWEDICQHFRDELEKKSPVIASLQLSYDDLPTHLKRCLLCFSIYPEDSVIGAEQLVNWWVGEGLIQGKDDKTATELGFKYLSEIISRCLVEAVQRRGYDGRVYRCRMHDLVRELTIRIAQDEAFCSFNGEGKQLLTPDSRWLGFTSEMGAKSLKNNSKLRALLLISSSPIQSARSIELLSSLRVLDFSHNTLDKICIEDLLCWICSLERLAYLNLSGVAGLKKLPSSIRKLRNLQLLVLSRCNNLVKIHPSITNLKKMIVLDLGSCGLQYLPRGLERLSHLQELSGFKVVSKANRQYCRLLELKELKQLRILRISISNDSEISKEELTVLEELEKLKVLAINTEGCRKNNTLDILDQFVPPPSLQELYLRCYHRDSLPNWINPTKLKSLQYLCIEDGDLVHLRTPGSGADSQSTWKLEGICLKYLRWFDVNWETLKKDLPLLNYAEVSNCNSLHLPSNPDEPGVWRKNQDQEIVLSIEGESPLNITESENSPSVEIN